MNIPLPSAGGSSGLQSDWGLQGFSPSAFVEPGMSEIGQRNNPVGAGGLNAPLAQQASALAQIVSSKIGVPAQLIWSQWAHETDGFKHLGAMNNMAGIRLPGSTQYRNFGSLAEFGDYYANLLKSKYGVAGAANESQFATSLKRGGYYTDTESNYEGGLKRYGGVYQKMFGASRSSNGGSLQTGEVHVTVNIAGNADPEKTKAATKQGVMEAMQVSHGKAIQRNLAYADTLGWGY